MNYVEKTEINVDRLKRDHKKLIKNNKLVLMFYKLA